MANGANGADAASWPAMLIPPYRDGRSEQAHADLVEDLRVKLRAAESRERQLHQHLIFHLQEKDVLLNQVAELQRVCEGLLLAQAQSQSNGGAQERLSAASSIGTSRPSPMATGVVAAAQGGASLPQGEMPSISALPPPQASVGGVKDGQLTLSGGPGKSQGTGGSTGTGAPPRLSTSLKAIMEPAGVSHSRQTETTTSSVLKGATSSVTAVPTPVHANGWSDGASPVLGTPAGATFVAAVNGSAATGHEQAKAMGAGQGRPATEIPQLLREKGGHIRIMELWESYQSRFGVTCYTLKDLFAMIKAGKIPGVVHEPPTGIRLVTSIKRQQTQVLPPPPPTLPPQQQQDEQPKQSQLSVIAGSLDREWCSSSPGPVAGLTQFPAGNVSVSNVATGGGWEQGFSADLAATETHLRGEGQAQSDGAESRGGSPGSDVGGAGGGGKSYSEKAGGGEGKSSIERGEKEVVDWRNLQRNVNFLLKGEGPLSAREFNESYTKRFRRAPYLDGFTLRYAVTAGWIKGVCVDARSKKYNLVMKVPERCREPPPDDAPTSPPDLQQQQSLRMTEIKWGKISEEFRILLAEGTLDPNELNAQYRKKFKKQLALHGFTIRSAVSAGHLEGVTIDSETLRLKLA